MVNYPKEHKGRAYTRAQVRVEPVDDALLTPTRAQVAIWQRKPGKGLLWHTDRGSQYAPGSHRALLTQHGIIQGMSRKGGYREAALGV